MDGHSSQRSCIQGVPGIFQTFFQLLAPSRTTRQACCGLELAHAACSIVPGKKERRKKNRTFIFHSHRTKHTCSTFVIHLYNGTRGQHIQHTAHSAKQRQKDVTSIDYQWRQVPLPLQCSINKGQRLIATGPDKKMQNTEKNI